MNIIKIINRLYDDNKLDTNNIESLDRLKTDVTGACVKVKISDQHYANLKNEISMLYEKIYQKRLESLNGKLDLDDVRIKSHSLWRRKDKRIAL